MLVLSACSLNHGRPIATLQISKVEQLRNTGIYQIYFASDIDLLGLFKSSIGQGLICSLSDDLDFSQAHHIKQSGFGLVEEVSAEPGLYRADVIFSESEKSSGGERYLQGDTLAPFLMKKDSIVCLFRVHSTTYTTYFSNVMKVPSKELLKANAEY
jgi:hypothetical protein